ncbi:MAG: hypothetical protein PHW82_16330 [Bacteroidales bacterium]|nr:hypothetical protein [Bacteroidales bacterium]
MDIKKLRNIFGKDVILDKKYPKPYPENIDEPNKIKAIVLGCDPSNFSKKDGSTKLLEFVFGIAGDNKDGRYFAGIKTNLSELGIGIDEIYVQNLCRNYFNKETAKNKIWMEAAKLWRITLKQELDVLVDSDIPVLVTSEKIYHALINDNETRHIPKEIYSSPDLVPFINNFLERPLIPFYRHQNYSMRKNPDYAKHITQILNNTANAR